MEYEMRQAKTETEAVEIAKNSLAVLAEQIEFYRGTRKRAWNGEFVDHVTSEAKQALSFLADRFPPPRGEQPARHHPIDDRLR